ncbi:hypothetical protein F5880DRAFT_1661150 [Lentinula raphanica]|nr:hypothetical protein F5880DRAFT_1661150 [Lentinula raphanica]
MNTTTIPSACSQCSFSPQHDIPPVPPSNSSRIDHLHHSNEYPTEKEELAFQSFIADGRSFLSRLDTRIATVKALLLELEATRENLIPLIPTYTQPLNPVRRLPSDILKLIFTYGTEYDKPEEKYFACVPHSLDLRSPQWIYGRVCRHWRRTMVDESPLFWTRIKLQPGKPISLKQLSMALCLLSIHLHRSQDCPLTIRIDMPLSFSMDLVTGFLALVFSHSKRLRSLFLTGGPRLNEIMAVSEDFFPSLEKIHIRELFPKTSDSQGDQGSVFRSIQAPKLKSWSSTGNFFFNTRISLMPPAALCHQITDFTISEVSSSQIVSIVRLLPHLRVLPVWLLVPSSFSLDEVVHLPKLERFCVRQHPFMNLTGTAIAALMDVLSCPALVHLSLFVSGQIATAVQRFEERSKFKLQHFVGAEDAGIFVKSLSNCLSLETIEVEGAYSYQSIQDMLASLYIPIQHAQSSTDTSLTRPIATFPNLRLLEFYFGELHSVEGFIDEAYSNVSARKFAEDVVPLELVITMPKKQAKKMLSYRQLKNFDALRVTVKIIPV